MDKALLLFAGGVLGALAVFLFYLRKDSSTPDDEEIKQQIFDQLTRMKKDIESTVD